jgi:hypothetical protein
MSLSDGTKRKLAQLMPRVTECTFFARPLPLIADEYPEPGDDFSFKAVFDPTDRHLVALEGEHRCESMKPFFAKGGFVELAIHEPTDQAVSKMWLLTFTPSLGDAKRGLLPIRLARDEAFILDIWTHPDFRRHSVAFTTAYEMGRVVDNLFPQFRWVYGYAHKDNAASRGLMEAVYGMWPVQEISEIEVGRSWVTKVPFSDQPKFGPFSKRGRHSGDGFNVPGRPRSGEQYRDYHHPDGFARGELTSEVCDAWHYVGDEWFDNDHPLDREGNRALLETLPRDLHSRVVVDG